MRYVEQRRPSLYAAETPIRAAFLLATRSIDFGYICRDRSATSGNETLPRESDLYTGLRSPMAMGSAMRFLWNATRGHRLRPWRSDYLRWRIETYSGREANTIDAREFFRFVWQEKGQLIRFLHWAGTLDDGK
jgi:hypothetical protein